MSALRTQASVHIGDATPDQAVGARARSRGGAGAGSTWNPDAMRTRREVVEHPFGTIKMRMGATHFLMKTLPKVATEMALAVLGDNLTRVINIVGVARMMEVVKA